MCVWIKNKYEVTDEKKTAQQQIKKDINACTRDSRQLTWTVSEKERSEESKWNGYTRIKEAKEIRWREKEMKKL